MRYGIKEQFFNMLKSNESFTMSANFMSCSNGKPKLKNYSCLFIRHLFKFGGSQMFYTRSTSYILHFGLLSGKSFFTTYKPGVLLEKGRFSTLSSIRATRSEASLSLRDQERGIINTYNLNKFYE